MEAPSHLLATWSFVSNGEQSLITARPQLMIDLRLIIEYENVSKRRRNGTSSDGRMSKMTIAMDVDAMLAPTLHC